MKLIFSILSILLIWMTLSGHQLPKSNDIQKIEFNTLSRGGHYEQIVITEDKLRFQKEKRRTKEEKETYSRILKAVEWKQLLKTTEHLNLHGIPKLKSPSMKRAYDGARHSAIIITAFDNQQYIHRFDDENPHKLLRPLLQSILKLVPSENSSFGFQITIGCRLT